MIHKWQILKSMLVKDMLNNFAQQNGTNKRFVVLRENDPSSKLPTIYIPDLPDNTVVLKTDYDDTEPVFFDSRFDLRRRNDYILLTELNGKNIVVHIEMKSKTLKREHIKRQMNGGNCFLEYLESVSRRLLDSPFSFNDPSCIEHRYVVIHVLNKPMKFFKENKMSQPRIGHNSLSNIFYYPVYTGGRKQPKIVKYNELVKI